MLCLDFCAEEGTPDKCLTQLLQSSIEIYTQFIEQLQEAVNR